MSEELTGTLTDQFADLSVVEPYQTLRKAGVVDRCNKLTPEGKKLYDQWRFEKDIEEFKNDCVAKILAAQKKKKK